MTIAMKNVEILRPIKIGIIKYIELLKSLKPYLYLF